MWGLSQYREQPPQNIIAALATNAGVRCETSLFQILASKRVKNSEQEANAKLMHAAPEMKEALLNCLSALETHIINGERLSDHYQGRIEAARAALEKAGAL
jgi:hypothetical protein